VWQGLFILTKEHVSMRFRVAIEGMTPLLMNRFHEAAEIAVGSGERPTFSGSKGTPREQADPKAYRDGNGQLYIPGTNIFASLIEAGKFHKVGKRQLTTRDTSLIPAGVAIEELVCPLGTDVYEIDSRSVVNPSTKGRIMCHRPRLDTWKTTFTLDVDTSVFNPKLIRQVLDDERRSGPPGRVPARLQQGPRRHEGPIRVPRADRPEQSPGPARRIAATHRRLRAIQRDHDRPLGTASEGRRRDPLVPLRWGGERPA
jgi:hypothetical protein